MIDSQDSKVISKEERDHHKGDIIHLKHNPKDDYLISLGTKGESGILNVYKGKQELATSKRTLFSSGITTIR